ncbi:MAG TPA: PHP domain-containing protein [Solirubrobacteraceae bacterium]|nr:PHP domain-containing protein [Solirubrobacteraceae bacterium]
MTSPTFDLQSHSIHSDGALPAHEVVRRAAAAGVELLALSDHDTVDGVDEALRAGEQGGVKVVRAVEISSVQAEYEDLHILGYGIDHGDEHLRAELARYRGDRETRAKRMQRALEELGWEIDESVLAQRSAAGKPIGRPHLSQAAFKHPANAQRIRDEGFATFSDLLVAYLIPGRPAYRARTFPTVREAIDLIHRAGGVAVWAHPFWDIDADPAVLETIDRFVDFGIDGVEVFYVAHTRDQTLLLADACEERDLLMTGSADFHGPDHAHFARFRAFELHGREPRLGPIPNG